jgi:4-aminobutyrate aminotransferase-like enzyme
MRSQARFPGHILDVRGRGCMVGLEFAHPAGSGFAGAVTAAAMDAGLLLLTTGWRETIRFIPALVVSEQEMATALGMFALALEKTVASWQGAQPAAAAVPRRY